MAFSIGGESEYRVALGVQDRTQRPAASVSEGEGGLYYAGEYKVFLASDGTVHLSAQAGAEFVALSQKVLTELNKIKTAYDLHTHPTAMGPSSAPTAPMTAPSSVAATKVKAS